jgi:putative ABC transport system permease protein
VTAVATTADARSTRRGGAPARRAIVRWSFRMFRREWRRQALILALLTVAVAATTVGLAVITNVAELHADPTFGTASTMIELSGSDQHLAADLAAMRQRLGPIDVVAHQRVPVPGSVSTLDIRAENPHGVYAARTVRLTAGHDPTGASQVALTRSVASLFGVRVGGSWSAGGTTYHVVGTVENPLDLSDQFALVAPGALAAPTNISVLTNASGSAVQNFRLPRNTGVSIDSRGTASKTSIEAVILALATIGMLFVGLLAVAGFAVVAQRRMRAFGVLSSVGASDRSVRLVMLANGAAVGLTSAVVGGLLGVGVWLAIYRPIESVVDHRIDPLGLPWFAVVLGLVLAFVTSVLAAWWPARAAARVPVVAALSGRPPARQPAHRFAAVGVVVLGVGIALLAFTDQHRAGFIIGGIIASVVGLLLLAPLAIQCLALAAKRTPISIRLALRDLSRYQARSGAALGAATLAIAIAATIAISAAAAQTTASNPNLAASELMLYVGAKPIGPGATVPVLDSSQSAAVNGAVKQIATSLHTSALELEAPYNPSGPIQTPGQGPGDELGGRSVVSLAHVFPEGQGIEIDAAANVYVGTPAVLAQFGIRPSSIRTTSEFITSRTDLSKMSVFDPSLRSNRAPLVSSMQIVKQLPRYQSDPNVLITPYGLHKLGFAAMPEAWLFHTPAALSSAQIAAARRAAASAGLVIETRSAPKSFAPLRNWSTAAGILVALGVLAMTVGLIRSEAGRDLRTLTATGASRRTRRNITGASTGALGVLAAVMGTAGAYAALLAWHRSDLHPLTHVPWVNLALIVVALPALAVASGWLVAGREPPVVSRQPLE